MPQKLTKGMVLRLINEEQSKIVAGLRVKHKKTGLKYTVNSVEDGAITLLTPENTPHSVTSKEFESSYEPA